MLQVQQGTASMFHIIPYQWLEAEEQQNMNMHRHPAVRKVFNEVYGRSGIAMWACGQ